MKGVQSPSRGSRPSGKRSIARVRKAFRPDVLARVCTLQDFSGYAPRTDLPARQGRERFLHYRDNGSNVLAVAHLDSVQPHTACTVVGTAAGPLALSGVLDDRLGAYVILEMLPRLGVTTDWLLTTDEEMGESTAAEFSSEKPYHWTFQFDRGGTDVVMYDYETPELVEMVEASGARVGGGPSRTSACSNTSGARGSTGESATATTTVLAPTPGWRTPSGWWPASCASTPPTQMRPCPTRRGATTATSSGSPSGSGATSVARR